MYLHESMQLLQLVGVLIVVNTLTCAGWFVANGKALGGGGVTLIIFSLVTGLALIFNERALEITFGKTATIKAAAKQATVDANEIAKVRERVEAQAATLDLVAKESADAKNLLQKLKEENGKAEAKLSLLESQTEVINQARAPRTISDENAKKLYDALKALWNTQDFKFETPIVIVFPEGDQEALNLADHIARIFKAANFNVNPIQSAQNLFCNSATYVDVGTAYEMGVYPHGFSAMEVADVLKNELKSSKIHSSDSFGGMKIPGAFAIMVYPKNFRGEPYKEVVFPEIKIPHDPEGTRPSPPKQ